MGAGPVTVSDPGTWRIGGDDAARTQGLVASPFAHLPCSVALFLESSAPGGAWIAALRTAVAITDCTGKAKDDTGGDAPCAALALTATGLAKLGLDAATMAGFAQPFREGMHETNRRRRLGDVPASADPMPSTVQAGGPVWSGNAPDPYPGQSDGPPLVTGITVHALLLLYAPDDAQLAAQRAAAEAALAAHGVATVHELPLSLRFDAHGIAREHFGFADGISQPVPHGDAIVTDAGGAFPADPLHGVFAGDILIGHLGAHAAIAPGPVLPADVPGAALLPLAADGTARDLGLDGSYLVVRELSQDVDAFNTSMEAAAAALGVDPDWVAERAVGRRKDGTILAPGEIPPATEDGPWNGFRFFDADQHGLSCPMGSHVRRANPRDSLARDTGSTATLLAAANNHRILRRGRKYECPDGTRGLLFMCLNTDIARQFEFVQQTWMLNRNFCTLYDETDPLLGSRGPFTIPAIPLRKRVEIATFIRFVGGEYFFLPSLPALDYLGGLP